MKDFPIILQLATLLARYLDAHGSTNRTARVAARVLLKSLEEPLADEKWKELTSDLRRIRSTVEISDFVNRFKDLKCSHCDRVIERKSTQSDLCFHCWGDILGIER